MIIIYVKYSIINNYEIQIKKQNINKINIF